jgi:hypothetical protein
VGLAPSPSRLASHLDVIDTTTSDSRSFLVPERLPSFEIGVSLVLSGPGSCQDDRFSLAVSQCSIFFYDRPTHGKGQVGPSVR